MHEIDIGRQLQRNLDRQKINEDSKPKGIFALITKALNLIVTASNLYLQS
jgi:hypothetical protein